ncbi:MAG: VOC family protein [Mycobacterium sp.]|nr:MAG: VOC family protein [Mycobacterium sp.]
MNVSHVGLRVRDMETIKRFYEALGFAQVKQLMVPDSVAGSLLGLKAPIGFEAIYLENAGFVLQLLTFAEYPAPEEPERSMVHSGLTHLSIAVDDVAAAQEAVRAAGGCVIADPGGGFACMVSDPEGQLVELINSAVRPVPQR